MKNTIDLEALSPLDGRYKDKVSILRDYFSEQALISRRIRVEIEYLKILSKFKVIRSLTKKELSFLDELARLDIDSLKRIKEIERETRHDVKSVEYYIRERFENTTLNDISSFIHFAVTSADINNLSYRLMIKDSLSEVLKPAMLDILLHLNKLSKKYASLSMLARTHGQAAIPTTLGKEFMVFELRIIELLEELKDFNFKGKLNGAVGGYQAMDFTYPKVDWVGLSKELVEDFGFNFVELTTQVVPADDLVKLFSIFHRFNSILIDLNQDIWRYISDGWLAQKNKTTFVGSSTMPQKINPIEFENSEGNLSVANSLFEGFMRKLPISRLQRDLSESTVMRNIGSAFGYCLLSYKSLIFGLSKLDVNERKIEKSLDENYNILLEAWQVEAKKNGDNEAYEKAAKMGKEKVMSIEDWQDFTGATSKTLSSLKPSSYLGLSVKLTTKNIKKVDKFFKTY